MEQQNQSRQETENSGAMLTHYSIEYLRRTAPWLKFFSILGFIASSLIFIAPFLSLGASGLMKEMNQTGAIGIGVMFFMYIAISILTFFPSKYLFNYADKIKGFIQTNDTSIIETAFLMQMKYWRLIGIISIICLSIIPISLIAFVIGDVLMT